MLVLRVVTCGSAYGNRTHNLVEVPEKKRHLLPCLGLKLEPKIVSRNVLAGTAMEPRSQRIDIVGVQEEDYTGLC